MLVNMICCLIYCTRVMQHKTRLIGVYEFQFALDNVVAFLIIFHSKPMGAQFQMNVYDITKSKKWAFLNAMVKL